MNAENSERGEFVKPLPKGILPNSQSLFGKTCRVERLNALVHGNQLWQAILDSGGGQRLWDYMAYGPFSDRDQFLFWLKQRELDSDSYFYVVIPQNSNKAVGMAALMRAQPAHGVIEIGNIWLSHEIQRTQIATESLFLLMNHAFEHLGNRRLEWKCDNLNARSKRAAIRFGFEYEGLFRQHFVIKGRNRDTAWFAILDHQWPQCRAAFNAWLAADNFTSVGVQIKTLSAIRETLAKLPLEQ